SGNHRFSFLPRTCKDTQMMMFPRLHRSAKRKESAFSLDSGRIAAEQADGAARRRPSKLEEKRPATRSRFFLTRTVCNRQNVVLYCGQCSPALLCPPEYSSYAPGKSAGVES